MIYKDECGRCFATPKDPEGLNVCLKTLVGSCGEHSLVHYKNTGNPLVLNIKMVPKQADGEAAKVTKLAIGKPGGIDAETDKYDTTVSVWCHCCQRALDHTRPEVAPIVDSILLAQSAYNQEAVGEWELELKPCPCVLNLDQTGATKIATKALAHCADCALKSNLWLCLQCGNLGCGRKNWDGSGGNNHGVEHWEKTGHCISVKLGTITAEGKASIHCYKCDLEILDPKLAEHLAVLGIDISSQVKTEKTIAE